MDLKINVLTLSFYGSLLFNPNLYFYKLQKGKIDFYISSQFLTTVYSRLLDLRLLVLIIIRKFLKPQQISNKTEEAGYQKTINAF
jgi:hypothetical protein